MCSPPIRFFLAMALVLGVGCSTSKEAEEGPEIGEGTIDPSDSIGGETSSGSDDEGGDETADAGASDGPDGEGTGADGTGGDGTGGDGTGGDGTGGDGTGGDGTGGDGTGGDGTGGDGTGADGGEAGSGSASDDDGGADDGSTDAAGPSVDILSPTEGELFSEFDTVNLSVEITDDEDSIDAMSLTGNSSIDGVLTFTAPSASGSIWTADLEGLSTGAHILSITAMDADGNIGDDFVFIQINAPPTAPAIRIVPNPAITGEALNAEITAPSVDPDGSTVTYSYQWYRDGLPYISEATVPPGLTRRGETWLLVVVPSDPFETGPSAEASITIGNAPPRIESVSLRPVSPATSDDIQAIPEGWFDSDGDTERYAYRWIVNGATDLDEVESIYPSSKTANGDVIQVIVTPIDILEEGEAVASDTVTIGNTAPSIERVNLVPENPKTDDDIEAVPEGWFDLDGDEEAYSFRWIVDGVTDLDETTSTFPASKTAKGTRVQVVVTPTDGASDGEDVASDTITVGNTPPEPGVVEITPELPEPGEALVCEVIEPAVDVDGDAFTYVFNWSIDGVERPEYITLSTDGVATIPVGDTENAETWTCSVYTDDGIDFSEVFSASVYVSDGTAPDPPTVNEVDSFRNDNAVDLTGLCEPGCELDFTCEDAERTWSLATSCSSEGEFSLTVAPLVRGRVTSCVGTCTDAAGNVSGPSIAAATEVCDPEDVFEVGSYGDALEDPVDEWESLPDDGTGTITLRGNILDDDEDDWYLVTATDDVAEDIANGFDLFRFDAVMEAGTEQYSFVIYRDAPESDSDDSCMPTDGYTEYSWFYETSDDGSFRDLPEDLQGCSVDSEELNTCEDHSADFFIHVKSSTATPVSCDPYIITLTNGVW